MSTPSSFPEDRRSAPANIPLRADHGCSSPAGPCDVRGVMLHPVQDPPGNAGSLPPRMFPRGIPSAALPAAVMTEGQAFCHGPFVMR